MITFPSGLQRFLLPPAAAALALLLQVGSSQAQAGSGSGPGLGSLSPSQRSELFKAYRSQALRAYPDRLAILRKGEACVKGAADLQALRTCRQEEGKALRALMSRQREEMRPVYQRLGLPLPGPKQGGGGRREPMGGGQPEAL